MLTKHLRQQCVELLRAVRETVAAAGRFEAGQLREAADACRQALGTARSHLQPALDAEAFARYGAALDAVWAGLGNPVANAAYAAETLDALLSQLVAEKVKLEVVFFPCRASMWDCMDSVWRAAAADPRCDVHVVPIPYYDRNPDGSFANKHYEGLALPADVPIADYRKYDPARRRPDVVYVHDAFDDSNTATSIEPRFYLRNLRPHVGAVVYLPYFSVNGKANEAHLLKDTYACVDRIVVSTAEFKEQLDQYWPPDKSVALGSPKTDSIFRATARKEELTPPAWRERIQGKIVLLCNLAIETLGYGEFAFAKLRSIFDCARRHPNVVLIWRPHPLFRATIASQLPRLLDAYDRLVAYFRQNDLGIFDDTPDAEKTIAIADAYLGDYSSIVPLFGLTGKPAFYLDYKLPIDTLEEDLLSFVPAFMSPPNELPVFTVDPKWLVFFNFNFETGEMSFIDDLPPKGIDFKRFFLPRPSPDRQRFYFAPYYGTSLCVYDATTKQSKFYDFDLPGEKGAFFMTLLHGDSLFLLPMFCSAIVEFNLKTETFSYYSDCLQDLAEQRPNDRASALVVSGVVRGDSVFLPGKGTNKLLEFNLVTHTHKIHSVGDDQVRFARIFPDDAGCWFLPMVNQRELARWNEATGAYETFSNYPPGFDAPEPCEAVPNVELFSSPVLMGDSLYLFPNCANMIVRVSLADGSMSEFRYKFPHRPDERKWPRTPLYGFNYFAALRWSEREILAFSGYDFSLHLIDVETGDYKAYPCRLPPEVLDRRRVPLREAFRADKYLPYAAWESLLQPPEWYINGLERHDYDPADIAAHYAANAVNADGSCGQKVHDYIMRLAERAGERP